MPLATGDKLGPYGILAPIGNGLNPGRNSRPGNTTEDINGAYNAVFNSVLKTGRRTSMIVDPPDGHMPSRGGAGAGDNPETTGQFSRRLFSGALSRCRYAVLPLNTLFGQGTEMRVTQSRKTFGISMEDDHDGGGNRVIYMDGRPHAPATARFYLGDSRGHWEGNTLVVETTNFLPGLLQPNLRTRTSERLKTIERITQVDANNLKREVTIEDPKIWTRPWTVLIQMGKSNDSTTQLIEVLVAGIAVEKEHGVVPPKVTITYRFDKSNGSNDWTRRKHITAPCPRRRHAI